MAAGFPSYTSQSDTDINFENLLPKKTKSSLPLNHESKYIQKHFQNFKIHPFGPTNSPIAKNLASLAIQSRYLATLGIF